MAVILALEKLRQEMKICCLVRPCLRTPKPKKQTRCAGAERGSDLRGQLLDERELGTTYVFFLDLCQPSWLALRPEAWAMC